MSVPTAPMAIPSATRILLCLRYGIGDLVMELPALDALRSQARGARITALGANPALEILAGDPRIDACVCAQDFGFRHWGDHGTDEARTAFRRWYREGGFDLVLDPSHAVSGAGGILWEPPLPQVRDAGESLQSEALHAGADGLDAVRYAVRRGWGLYVPPSAPRVHVSADAYCFARVFLAAQGDGSRVAALSPASSSPLKRWPLDCFIAAGRWLAERGARVVVLAGADEAALAEAIVAALPADRAVAATGLHLERVAALLARCHLLLCNDTGLMHIAAAVGCTPVAVFGPTSPNIYAPRGALPVGGRHGECRCRSTTKFGPPECVAAGVCERGEPTCIEQIPLQEVIDALNVVWNKGLDS